MHPVLFTIPIINWPVHIYGIMVVSGFLLAIFVAYRQAAQHGTMEDDVLDFGFWALLGGIFGARLIFILVEWQDFFVHRPFIEFGNTGIKIPHVLALWRGGIVYWGSFLGGFAAFWFFTKSRKLNRWQFADFLIVGLPLGQVLGRLGCVFAGCCWGSPMYHLDNSGSVINNLPVAMRFPPGSLAYDIMIQSADSKTFALMNQLGTTLPLFPSQFAESLGAGLIFFILLYLSPRKSFHGQLLVIWAILYSILRFFIEIGRGDAQRGYVIDNLVSTSQFISLAIIACSLIAWFFLSRKNKNQINKHHG